MVLQPKVEWMKTVSVYLKPIRTHAPLFSTLALLETVDFMNDSTLISTYQDL